MLTRAQVAARLGKSVATVRRLEGVVLHPHRGRNGVRLFNPYEVERVAREGYEPQLRSAHGRRTESTRGRREPRREEPQRWPSAGEYDQMRELARFLAHIFVDTASNRMIAALEPDIAEAIAALLED